MRHREPNHSYAELELRHVQLELEHRRFQHLRHFIDQYYCYRKGIVKRTGTADWESVVWKGVVSTRARSLEPDRSQVVKEHVVPIRAIARLLSNLVSAGQTGLADIAGVLDKYTVFGTITKYEDQLLRTAGLTSTMPEGFFEPGHLYYQDVLARYKAVGIALEPIGA